MTQDFTQPQQPTPEPIIPEHVPPSVGPDPMGRVKGPAIGLIATAVLGGVGGLVGLVINILGVGASAMEVQEGMMFAMGSGAIGIIQAVVGLAVAGFIVFACLKMMKLESWGMALTASILAMVPMLSPCCLLGIPFGIWALIVLMDQGVKSAFRG